MSQQDLDGPINVPLSQKRRPKRKCCHRCCTSCLLDKPYCCMKEGEELECCGDFMFEWGIPTLIALIFGYGILAFFTYLFMINDGDGCGDKHWNWEKASYFTVCTMTTLGYGDVSPDTTNRRYIAVVLIFVSTTWLMAIFQYVVQSLVYGTCSIGCIRNCFKKRIFKMESGQVGGSLDRPNTEVGQVPQREMPSFLHKKSGSRSGHKSIQVNDGEGDDDDDYVVDTDEYYWGVLSKLDEFIENENEFARIKTNTIRCMFHDNLRGAKNIKFSKFLDKNFSENDEEFSKYLVGNDNEDEKHDGMLLKKSDFILFLFATLFYCTWLIGWAGAFHGTPTGKCNDSNSGGCETGMPTSATTSSPIISFDNMTVPDTTTATTTTATAITTTVTGGECVDKDMFDWETALYFGIVTSSTVGYGDYAAFGDVEYSLGKKWFMILMMVPGVLLYLLFVGIFTKMYLRCAFWCSIECCCVKRGIECRPPCCHFGWCETLYQERYWDKMDQILQYSHMAGKTDVRINPAFVRQWKPDVESKYPCLSYCICCCPGTWRWKGKWHWGTESSFDYKNANPKEENPEENVEKLGTSDSSIPEDVKKRDAQKCDCGGGCCLEWVWPTIASAIFAISVIMIFAAWFEDVSDDGEYNWGWPRSIYFTVYTMTTIGYGDFAPENGRGQWAAIVLIYASGTWLFAVIGYLFQAILNGPPFLIAKLKCGKYCKVDVDGDPFESEIYWGVGTMLDEFIESLPLYKKKRKAFAKNMFKDSFKLLLNDNFKKPDNYFYKNRKYSFATKKKFLKWLDGTFNDGNSKFMDLLGDEEDDCIQKCCDSWGQKIDDVQNIVQDKNKHCCTKIAAECGACWCICCSNKLCDKSDFVLWIFITFVYFLWHSIWWGYFTDHKTGACNDDECDRFEFLEAHYYAVVTSSTVGYGDYKAYGNDEDWGPTTIQMVTYGQIAGIVLFIFWSGLFSKLILRVFYWTSYKCCCEKRPTSTEHAWCQCAGCSCGYCACGCCHLCRFPFCYWGLCRTTYDRRLYDRYTILYALRSQLDNNDNNDNDNDNDNDKDTVELRVQDTEFHEMEAKYNYDYGKGDNNNNNNSNDDNPEPQPEMQQSIQMVLHDPDDNDNDNTISRNRNNTNRRRQRRSDPSPKNQRSIEVVEDGGSDAENDGPVGAENDAYRTDNNNVGFVVADNIDDEDEDEDEDDEIP